jgi:hypothetical protein
MDVFVIATPGLIQFLKTHELEKSSQFQDIRKSIRIWRDGFAGSFRFLTHRQNNERV